MKMIFDPRQTAHAPAQEMHNGGWTAHAEVPSRAQSIAAALGGTSAPTNHGMAAITAVHDPAYVAFLQFAHRRWRDAGREGDAIGYIWPVTRRRDVPLDRIDALLGRYSLDAGTPITPDTWDASHWAAQSALTALDAVLAGDQTAFALCRPPGHHGGADYLGGYCYLNNAAIAAQAARDAGADRVAILDIDYHHGNGTQDIFWNRGDVFFASIHADPRINYPFYWGHADERGEGAGEGATLNLPLPHGTTIAPYLAALEQALAAIRRFAPDMLIVSFGADTYEADPISHFAIRTQDYAEIAGAIAKLARPTVIVMEGGYAVEALGGNVSGFLSGFSM